MANLKSGTLIGGNLIWHQGNLEFKTTDDHLYFKDKEVYHEGHTPTPAEVGAVNKAGDTMGKLIIKTDRVDNVLQLHATGNPNQETVYQSWYNNSGTTRWGYMGYSGHGSTNFIMKNERGDNIEFFSKNGNATKGLRYNSNAVYHEGNKPTWTDVGGNSYFVKNSIGNIVVSNGENSWLMTSPDEGIIPSETGRGRCGLDNYQWQQVWSQNYRGGNVDVSGYVKTSHSIIRKMTDLDGKQVIFSGAEGGAGNYFGDTSRWARVHAKGALLQVMNETNNIYAVYHEGHKPTTSEIGAQPSLTTPFSTRDYRASATVQPELKDAANRSLVANSSYFVRLSTVSTGTSTGAVYVVTLDSKSVPKLQLIANKGTGSNHPELIIKENKVHIKTTHANEYNIRVFMQEAGTSSPNNMFVAETEYFSKFHKPDVSEVINAVNKTGDTMTGTLSTPAILANRFEKNDTSGTLITSPNTPVGNDIYMNWKGGNNIFAFRRGHDSNDNTTTITAFGNIVVNKYIEVAAKESNAVRLNNTDKAINTVASGVEAEWYGKTLRFGHKRGGSTDSKGFSASLDGVEIFNALPDGSGYLKGNKIYTTVYKPTWNDVGGNEFFTLDKTNKYIHTAHDYWNMASSDERGWMPSSSGNHGTSKSFLGNSTWWFKEAWVNTYRGSNIDVDGSVKVRNGAPTISLINTGNKSAFIHAESDRFYVLRSSENGGDGWDSGPGGRHPMVLDLNTGDAHFSRSIRGNYSESNAYASQYSTSAPFYHDYSTASTSAYFPMIKQRGVHSSGPEDWATSIGQLVGSTGVVETSLQMIKSDGTAKNWRFMTNGGFSSPGNIYENGDDRVYSTGNKPTWDDVGGNEFFAKVSDDHIQSTGGWLRASGDWSGFLPNDIGTGSNSKSQLGHSSWWFKEAWVNTYRGGSMNITGTVNAAAVSNTSNNNMIRQGGTGNNATVVGNTAEPTYIDTSDKIITRKDGSEGVVYTSLDKPTPEDVGAVPILELGGLDDYQQAVILLHKISGGASDFRYFAGTISFGRGNGLYEPFSYEINTTKQYNQIAPFGRAVSMGAYSSENYLCTCSYNGETYIALRIAHSDAQVARIDVSGSWSDTPVKVPYYTKANGSNPAVVNNADINGSIRKWKDAEQVTVTSVMQALFPVGHILHTTNPNNPTTYGYPGTWQLLPNEIFLQSTHTESSLGQTTGTNAPVVPVPQHNHGASIGGTTLNGRFNTNATGNHAHSGSTNTTGNHSHSGSTNATGNHSHNFAIGNSSGSGTYSTMGLNNQGKTAVTNTTGNHAHSFSTNTTGNHAHSFSTNTTGNHAHFTDVNFGSHVHGITIHASGTPGATLDVRGYRMLIYMWRRTA